jgi:cytochrome c553
MIEFAQSESSEVNSEVNLVEEVKVELSDIDISDLTEHAARFEALHGKLQEAPNTIEGL